MPMTSTLNPYVVDHSFHTEALFGLIKSNKVQPEATSGAPKAPARAGLSGMFKSKKAQPEATTGAPKAPARSVLGMFKKQTPAELSAKYAADTKNYTKVHWLATKNSITVYTCYYLQNPNKLLRCTSSLKPGWQGTPEALKSGTLTCRSPDSPDSVLVPYPSDKVLWSIS
jgi:hypothetical protein